jgi:hypothetical protein
MCSQDGYNNKIDHQSLFSIMYAVHRLNYYVFNFIRTPYFVFKFSSLLTH